MLTTKMTRHGPDRVDQEDDNEGNRRIGERSVKN